MSLSFLLSSEIDERGVGTSSGIAPAASCTYTKR
jgi:hypothetical protein